MQHTVIVVSYVTLSCSVNPPNISFSWMVGTSASNSALSSAANGCTDGSVHVTIIPTV